MMRLSIVVGMMILFSSISLSVTNIVQDPGFENSTNTTHNPYWNRTFDNPSQPTYKTSTIAGTWAAQIQWENISQLISVTNAMKGATYNLSANMNASLGAGGVVSLRVYKTLNATNLTTGVPLANMNVTAVNYTFNSTLFTMPADCLYIMIRLAPMAVIGEIDNISITGEESGIGYQAIAYELTSNPHNITFAYPTTTFTNMTLVYNHTLYIPVKINASTWVYNLTTPFVMTNNTAIDFFWNWTVGTINNASFNYTQTIRYAFTGNSTFSINNTLGGSTVFSFLAITNQTATANMNSYAYLTVNTTQYIDTDSTYNGTINYNASFTVQGGTNTHNWTLVTTYGTQTRYINFSTPTITGFIPTVTFCGDGNLTAVVYRTYDENTWKYLNYSNYYVRAVLIVGGVSREYSSSINVSQNISLCLYPIYLNTTADITLLYSNSYIAANTYSQRTWHNYNLPFNNASKDIDIYLINATNTYQTEIDTRDINNLIAPSVIVVAQKFNYTNNRWVNMTSVLTNDEGEASTYLERYNTPYTFILINSDGTTLNTYDNYFVIDSPITLRTSTTFINYVTVFQSIQVSCSYNNNTKILMCSFNDPEEELTSITLEVVQSGLWGMPTICNETKTSHSGVFTCDLSLVDAATKGFKYRVTGSIVHSPDREYILTWGVIDKPLPSIMGASGVWLALMVWMAIFFIGTWKPTVAIMVSLFGFFIVIWLGLIDFGTAGWELAMGLMVTIALLVMWRLKR